MKHKKTTMKDISFFFLKNFLAARKRRGFRSSCNGNNSTSTLNQHEKIDPGPSSMADNTPRHASSPATLEEMMLQLEMEEEMARRARLGDYYYTGNDNDDDNLSQLYHPVRMSCVNSSDILRSARNALNQYPRFSLDGKDAMYRSSFRRQLDAGADAARSNGRRSYSGPHHGVTSRRSTQRNVNSTCLPRTLAGESVVWCKPGVVAKLMGLEVIPLPVRGKNGKEKLGTLLKRERLRTRDQTTERRSLGAEMNGWDGFPNGEAEASCSKGGFCVMKPVGTLGSRGAGGWPTLRIT